jgi:hypothetical protein
MEICEGQTPFSTPACAQLVDHFLTFLSTGYQVRPPFSIISFWLKYCPNNIQILPLGMDRHVRAIKCVLQDLGDEELAAFLPAHTKEKLGLLKAVKNVRQVPVFIKL